MPVLIGKKGSVPAEIKEIWGKPALLPIEDPAMWDRLSEAISKAVEPVDMIDWLLVKDVADFTFQLYRLRRIQADLIVPTSLAGKTFKSLTAGSPDDFAKAEAEVTLVMTLNIEHFERIDQMIARAEACRAAILGEIERRREGWASRLRAASENVIEGELAKHAAAPAPAKPEGAPAKSPKLASSTLGPSGSGSAAP